MTSFHPIFLLLTMSFLLLGVQVHSCAPKTLSIRERYKKWMAKHNKIYTNSIEREERFQIFKKKIRYIDEFNAAGNKSYTLGLNIYSDLTKEEITSKFKGGLPPHIRMPTPTYKPQMVHAEDLPKSWDWREKGAVTPVKLQPCGDCWLLAGVAEVESINFIATSKLNVLSTQEILDCDDLPNRRGCDDGGWEQEVFEYVKHYGLTTEENYPKKGAQETCNKLKKETDRVARITKYLTMPPYLSDEELMATVVKHPITVGIDMNSTDFQYYESGVFSGKCNNEMNFVMQMVGFGETDEGLKYWILRNSWGDEWGEGGYVRLLRGTGNKEGLCGVNLCPSYPIY